MVEENTDEKFVEVDGVKYQEDPDHEGEALVGDDGKFVSLEEEKKEEVETHEKEEKEEENNEDDDDKNKEEDEEEKPKTRKSVQDYIIERKNKKIDKLKEKNKDKEEEDEEEDEVDSKEEKLTSKGRNAIREEVGDIIRPLIENVRNQSDNKELQDVFTKYPDAKDMEKKIRLYMEHDSYKNASVEFIYLGLAAKKMQLQKKRSKADEEAKADASGGHGKRNKSLGKLPDVNSLSDEDFDTFMTKVKTRQ